MRNLIPSVPALALATLLVGCSGGGSPTAPSASSGGARIALDRTEVTLAALGENATFAATVGGQPAGATALTVADERRWLHDRPVLDADALATGLVRAAAPGTAVVEISASGAASARLTVHVRPARPLLVAASETAVGDGDTLVLRGYGLDRLAAGSVRIGSLAATMLSADSATLRLALPSLPASGACAGAGREAVSASGADAVPGLSALRRRAGDLRLDVGKPVRLTDEQARCLRLFPAAGAEYALAWVDARLVNRAETGYEGYAPSPAVYSVNVAEAGQAAPSASLLPSRSLSAAVEGDVRRASTNAQAPAMRQTPWTEGERFAVADASFATPLPARVVRVYGGHLVLAIAEGEEPAGGMDAWLARADTAFQRLLAYGYPLFRTTLSGDSPVSSALSGQLLVVARRESSANLGVTAVGEVSGRPVSTVFLNTQYTFTSAGLLRTLAHEVVHAWHQEWAADRGAPGVGAPAWAQEGNADLLAWEVVRRALGMDRMANVEWAGDPARAPYAAIAASARGDLTAGYASAASFQADLVMRTVASGRTENAALTEVTAGVLEGWHGFDRFGGRRDGLTARMRRVLDGGWSPAGALLTWTLSQAVDDLTAASTLQNPAFARVSTSGKPFGTGWLAPAVLRSGGAAVREDATGPATVSGNAATVAWRYGSPNYVRIEDGGRGGAYRLTAGVGGGPMGEVEWMVVRYR